MAEKLITKLRDFPAVEELLQRTSLAATIVLVPRPLAAALVKEVIAQAKASLKTKKVKITEASIERDITRAIVGSRRQEITPVINATGIVIHTNLGRAPLAAELFDQVRDAVAGFGNIEYDLAGGARGGRGAACERYLALLSQAESGVVVNNNAAALLLILNSLANRKEVIISRGELVQIGGGFRIPDILKKSGARLREVGSTNITTLEDYQDNVTERTGMILKVHKSNFMQAGFTEEVAVGPLVELGRKFDVPVVNDLGSGVFIPTKKILGHVEPTVQQSVKSGADLTCFSGDKMLGGVQSGLIVGRKAVVEKLKRNPIFRTMRLDKIMVAFLERLLRVYLDGDPCDHVRLWQILAVPEATLYERGRQILDELGQPDGLSVSATSAYVGGGALPETRLPSVGIVFDSKYRPTAMMRDFRALEPPVIGRIEDDRYILDLKAVGENEMTALIRAIRKVTG
ncbi:MAG: L-seryl-tRNA(Sec) selenium transferase [candidate division Zixibacteria bacterium]|nr:L-seryl-tRNA(Sec) selenium transferase [candidate division Zixibacteria bacterium]MDH3937295.1 L-seryl-tRNA(Sec) selenium transferase [candidate division Zixibacteria bacterium]MDH4034345.1 L-seryl-tRNA(Sec) selenium transferase [candidate division Zixibacteria bacterium]